MPIVGESYARHYVPSIAHRIYTGNTAAAENTIPLSQRPLSHSLFSFFFIRRGTSLEQNLGLDQKDALHVCSCAHRDIARDLPEDIPCNCDIRQEHLRVFGWQEVSRHLNDEDVTVPFAVGTSSDLGTIGMDLDKTFPTTPSTHHRVDSTTQ
jgi:hypothetical protein